MGRRGPVPAVDGKRRPPGSASGREELALPSDSRPLAIPQRMPSPPREWHEQTKEKYRAIWRDPIARRLLARPVHRLTLIRLCEAYEERERTLIERAGSPRTTVSDKGVVALDPLLNYLAKLETVISRLETDLMLNPVALARMKLLDPANPGGLPDLPLPELPAPGAAGTEPEHVEAPGWSDA